MQRKTITILLLLAFTLGSVFVLAPGAASPARAQGGTCSFDFPLNDLDVGSAAGFAPLSYWGYDAGSQSWSGSFLTFPENGNNHSVVEVFQVPAYVTEIYAFSVHISVTGWAYNAYKEFWAQFLESPTTTLSLGSYIDYTDHPSSTYSGDLASSASHISNDANTYFTLTNQSYYGTVEYGPTLHIDGYCGSGTPTPSPSPTPTSTPTAIVTVGPLDLPADSGNCPLLGDDAAYFRNLPGRWNLAGSASNPSGSSSGLLLGEGSAGLNLTLNAYKQYKLTVGYHIAGSSGTATPSPTGTPAPTGTPIPGTTSSLFVKLGSDPPLPLPLTGVDSGGIVKTFTDTYNPNDTSGAYTLTLLSTADTPGLTIDSICVAPLASTISAGGSSSGTSGGTAGYGNGANGTCTACTYNPTGDLTHDVPALFNWLLCILSQLWQCGLSPSMGGVLQFAVDSIKGVLNMGTWAGSTAGGGVNWLLSLATSAIRYGAGTATNGATTITNAISKASAASTSTSTTVTNYSVSIQSASDFFTFISNLITVAIQALGQVLDFMLSIVRIMPLLFNSLIAGFNQSANTAVINWMPACNVGVAHYMCLGVYVMDNTIFEGPAFYIVLCLEAVIAIKAVVWAIQAFRKGMSWQ
jgi:hypothetical protein